MKEVNYSTLNHSTVLVTGGNGFLGKHVVKELKSHGANVIAPNSSEMNLFYLDDIFKFVNKYEPEYVIHMAGYNGGIQFNKENPADIFIQNTVMGMNLHAAIKYSSKLERCMSVVASCAWTQPKYSYIRPCDILKKEPDYSVACHGYAKRNLFLTSEFFRLQFDVPSYTSCITTMYGPGDTFDPLRTKVMGAMIKRFCDAKRDNLPEVSCWGTGDVLRQFVYVEDAAKMLVKSLLVDIKTAYPLFISDSNDGVVTIKELAHKVAELCGYNGKILWDSTKPTGQHSKTMECHKSLILDKYTKLEEGILKTIQYYKDTQ